MGVLDDGQVVTHLRFHQLHPHQPPFLLLTPPLRLPLNVRQVIYTLGFTARKILRKAVTRDQNATRGTTVSSKNEKRFFYETGALPMRSSIFLRAFGRREIVGYT